MTYTEDMNAEIDKIRAIELPADTAPSRLHRPPKPENGDDSDIVRAADRFAAFRESHPTGFVDTELVQVIQQPTGDVTYVMRANVWTGVANGRPDATAWAQGSTASENPIIAAAPIESADTIARSRALRNLGILPEPTKPGATPTPIVPVSEPALPPNKSQGIGDARRAAELTQIQLAQRMRLEGFPWTQAVVSKVERGTRSVTAGEAVALAGLIGYEDTPAESS